jgi:hypothetical protein
MTFQSAIVSENGQLNMGTTQGFGSQCVATLANINFLRHGLNMSGRPWAVAPAIRSESGLALIAFHESDAVLMPPEAVAKVGLNRKTVEAIREKQRVTKELKEGLGMEAEEIEAWKKVAAQSRGSKNEKEKESRASNQHYREEIKEGKVQLGSRIRTENVFAIAGRNHNHYGLRRYSSSEIASSIRGRARRAP